MTSIKDIDMLICVWKQKKRQFAKTQNWKESHKSIGDKTMWEGPKVLPLWDTHLNGTSNDSWTIAMGSTTIRQWYFHQWKDWYWIR